MKVGDYVRTKNNGIRKILDIGEYLGMKQYLIDEDGTYVIDNSIIKSEKRLIDLIELEDYVNGYKVISLWKDKTKVIGVAVDGSVIGFDECEIKSIVTKEQFLQMEYKVGE